MILPLRLELLSKIPKGRCQNGTTVMSAGAACANEFSRDRIADQATRVHEFRIMAAVPAPDVRRAEHRSCPVIAERGVGSCFDVALLVWCPERVGQKVGCIPRDVVTVCLVDLTGDVGSVAAVGSS